MNSPTRTTIVVGVDGSTSARHAALWAADEAAQRHLRLRLVYANNEFAFGSTGGLAPPQSFFDAMQTAGFKLLADAESAIREVHPDLPISVDLQTAAAVPSLLAQTEDALLLVLGSRGTGGFRGILVGSTAVALVAHGDCPVAVIRGSTADAAPPAEGPVVVGVDGSPTSDAAIATAFDEASWRGAELVAVHAWLEYASDHVLHRGLDEGWEQAEQGEQELLAQRLAGWQEKYPDVEVRRVIKQGQPVELLLEHAAGAQLVVVGSRGNGGFSGMLLGSTSQASVVASTGGADGSSCCVRPNGQASGVVRPDRTVSFDGGCDWSTASGSEHTTTFERTTTCASAWVSMGWAESAEVYCAG